ncbi:hypothetical protein BH11CYA1_BH11CYA1_50540 [soil metagenome]
MYFNILSKSLLAALFSLTLATSTLSSSASAAGLPSRDEIKSVAKLSLKNIQVFSSPAHNFSINFPDNWTKVEPKDSPIVCKFLVLNGLASYRVAVETVPAGTTLSDYFKATTEQVKVAMAAARMPVTIASETDSKLAGVAAKKSIYTFTFEDSAHIPKTEQYLAINGNKGYVFNYTADSEVFDDFREVIDTVLNSMEFH